MLWTATLESAVATSYGEHYVLLTNSGTARIENEDIDLNTKERGSSEEKIVDIIESEEKTEILTSGKIMTFDVFLYTGISFLNELGF